MALGLDAGFGGAEVLAGASVTGATGVAAGASALARTGGLVLGG